MPEVVRIVFIYIGGLLEEEVNQEVAIVLVHMEELKETLFSLARELRVCQTI